MTTDQDSPILILGGSGLLGSALYRGLKGGKQKIFRPTSSELDLTDQAGVASYFDLNGPFSVVYMAAGLVGGILANSLNQSEFLSKNIRMGLNVIDEARQRQIKTVYFGSSCIYPVGSSQPISESSLFTGVFESTNEGYAIAKSSCLRYGVMCSSNEPEFDFRALMPTNLYGPGDNYDEKTGHVIAGLIVKVVDAINHSKNCFEVWGTGKPLREFLFIDDLVSAAILVSNLSKQDYKSAVGEHGFLNVGSGQECSIADLATKIKRIAGYSGEIHFNKDYPDGIARKIVDSSIIRGLGWRPDVDLDHGLDVSIRSYLKD